MKQFVEVTKNFFNDEELKIIIDYGEEIFEEKHLLGNDKSLGWGPGLNPSSSDIHIYPVDPSIDSEIHGMISEKAKQHFNMKIQGICYHWWLPGSHIHWHNDANRGGAATIYLNPEWDKEYNGFFIYELDGNFGIELPEFNKCVFQHGGVMHATTPVSLNAPIRKSLQIFLNHE